MTAKPKPVEDAIGIGAYRLDTAFFVGYALLVGGMLLFGADPRYIFAGVALELLFGLIANVVRLAMVPGGQAGTVATLLIIPPFLAALGFITWAGLSLLGAEAIGWMTVLSLLAFVASVAYSRVLRYRHATVKQMRFTVDLNKRYCYADGQPLLGPMSLATGPVVEAWLVTMVFMASWFTAGVVEVVSPGGDDGLIPMLDTIAGGLTLAVLCFVREVVVALIAAANYPKGVEQEKLWLERFGRVGKVVRRDALEASPANPAE